MMLQYTQGTSNPTVYRIFSDHLGSPRLVVNVADGTILFEANYSAFGKRTRISGDEDAIPFGFAGGLYDSDTKLTRFGARDYDARFGRWVSKDPILFDGGQGDLYVYVANDPIQWTDPSGHGIVVGVAIWGICNGMSFTQLSQGLVDASTRMDHIADLRREQETWWKGNPFMSEEGEARCKEIDREISNLEYDFTKDQATKEPGKSIMIESLCVGLGIIGGLLPTP